MLKAQTHYEQVPLDVVHRVVKDPTWHEERVPPVPVTNKKLLAHHPKAGPEVVRLWKW